MTRGPIQHLPFDPLWQWYAGRWCASRDVDPSAGHFAAVAEVSRGTVHRWRDEGRILLHPADRVATALGVHPIEVWGDTWLDVPDVRVPAVTVTRSASCTSSAHEAGECCVVHLRDRAAPFAGLIELILDTEAELVTARTAEGARTA